MRRSPIWLVSSLALATACSKPADKAAEAPPADTAAAAAPAAPAGPQAIVTVIYKHAQGPGGVREVLQGDPPAAGEQPSSRRSDSPRRS